MVVEPGWAQVVLFAVVVGAAGFAGVWIMHRHEEWARRHTGELITFASGLLVAGSLLHLLRRAGELTSGAAAAGWALAAFAVLYVVENHFIPHPHLRTEEAAVGHRHTAGPAAVVGLGVHGVLDGVAVGAGFSAGFVTGAVILFLVVSHKLPVGIASMGALYHAGADRRSAFRWGTVVALVSPLAVLVTFAFLRGASPALLGAVVAAAGGSFLYVGAADLLPEGQASGSLRHTLLFLAGAGLMVLVALLRMDVH